MQNEKIATRVAYGRALAALGEKYDFFVMDADLSGSTQTAMFGKKFPERFANCGIAEANMVSTAAGIASTGLPVFVSSFAMFACGRAPHHRAAMETSRGIQRARLCKTSEKYHCGAVGKRGKYAGQSGPLRQSWQYGSGPLPVSSEP